MTRLKTWIIWLKVIIEVISVHKFDPACICFESTNRKSWFTAACFTTVPRSPLAEPRLHRPRGGGRPTRRRRHCCSDRAGLHIRAFISSTQQRGKGEQSVRFASVHDGAWLASWLTWIEGAPFFACIDAVRIFIVDTRWSSLADSFPINENRAHVDV